MAVTVTRSGGELSGRDVHRGVEKAVRRVYVMTSVIVTPGGDSPGYAGSN
jgi:hypothetical protein